MPPKSGVEIVNEVGVDSDSRCSGEGLLAASEGSR